MDGSEVDSYIEVECAAMSLGKAVVCDVGKAELVVDFGIEYVVAHAASEDESAVEVTEVALAECRPRLAGVIVLDLSANAMCEITAQMWDDGDVVVEFDGILHNDGHLEVVEVVLQIAIVASIFAAFLRVEQSGFEIDGGAWRQLQASHGTEVQT